MSLCQCHECFDVLRWKLPFHKMFNWLALQKSRFRSFCRKIYFFHFSSFCLPGFSVLFSFRLLLQPRTSRSHCRKAVITKKKQFSYSFTFYSLKYPCLPDELKNCCRCVPVVLVSTCCVDTWRVRFETTPVSTISSGNITFCNFCCFQCASL